MKTRGVFVVYCVLLLTGWCIVYSVARTHLLLFSFLGFAIGWAVYRLPTRIQNETLQSFFLYERKMPSQEFIGTLVTTNVGFFSSVAFSCVLIVTTGIGPAVIAVIAWILGLVWFSHYIPKLIEFFRKGSTVHEYIAQSYGRTPEQKRHLRFYSSIITFLLYVASVGAEIKFTSDVFSVPIGLDTFWLAIALSVAGIIYVSISGYRGVVSTGRLQYWAILAGVAAIYYFIGHSIAINGFTWPADFISVKMLTIGPAPFALFTLFVLLVMYQFCVMDMWERCIAIVNTAPQLTGEELNKFVIGNIRRRIVWSIVPFVILFGAWYGIGLLSLGQNWTDDPNKIIPCLIDRLGYFASQSFTGAVVQTLVVLCFSAAALSTIDGFIIAAVQTIIFDWLPSFTADHKECTELDEMKSRQWLTLARILILVVGAVAVGIAYTQFGIMSFWVGMYSVMLAFFPAIFFSIHFGRAFEEQQSATRVAVSIVLGAASALICAILGTFVYPDSQILGQLPPLLAVGVSAFVLLLSSHKSALKNWFILFLALGGAFYLFSKPTPKPPQPELNPSTETRTNMNLNTNNITK
jgi:Na+/proline symporter